MATAEAIAIRTAIAAEKQAEAWKSIDARLQRIEASFGIHEPASPEPVVDTSAGLSKPAVPPAIPDVPPPRAAEPLKPAPLAPPGK
jgi:hypothetical protein